MIPLDELLQLEDAKRIVDRLLREGYGSGSPTRELLLVSVSRDLAEVIGDMAQDLAHDLAETRAKEAQTEEPHGPR
jgi:hypothetical protein